jgi:hypothetical protein
MSFQGIKRGDTVKKIVLTLGLIILLIGLLLPAEVIAQQPVYKGEATVQQSGPRYKWCSGPHEFFVDVRAKVHHWIFAFFQHTRIRYDVWKPGNYRVKKKLIAYSNEPISVTITGVEHLVHQQNPAFPRIYHWVALSPDPPFLNEIQEMTDPILADGVDDQGNPVPNWTDPVPVEADPEWMPGTRMPEALYAELELDTPPIGEDAKDNETPGVDPVPEATWPPPGIVRPAENFLDVDVALLQLAPLQVGEAPIPGTEGDDPFIIRKWLHDGICVGWWNRSCDYADPGGYTVTVTANPAYPHPAAG